MSSSITLIEWSVFPIITFLYLFIFLTSIIICIVLGNDGIKRLKLEPSSPLYVKLCGAGVDGFCTFPGKIVFDKNLVYDKAAQSGIEYKIDTIRTVRLQIGSNRIHYEYLRPACVDQVFLGSNAKKVIRKDIGSDKKVASSVCADPKRQIATEMCCQGSNHGFRFCNYQGERMRYDSAVDRCKENGMVQCNPMRLSNGGRCSEDVKNDVWSSWTSVGCATRAKISFETGHIGRVDYPEPDYAGKRYVSHFVNDSTLNFYKVAWLSETTTLPSSIESCKAISSCYSVKDGCVCETLVVERVIFHDATEISSKDDVLSALHIGGFQPEMFDAEKNIEFECGIVGVKFYSQSKGSCDNFGSDTFIGVVDNYGMHYLKNVQLDVEIKGTTLRFRNPVQFISMVDQDLRDMHYETEAVLDTFFHHPSHPPFLAIRMIQRFGISNPSPGYIKRVATAYATGLYKTIGQGKYGDLSAM